MIIMSTKEEALRNAIFIPKNKTTERLIIMDSKKFIELCKKIVSDYTTEHLEKTGETQNFDVFVVWSCKTLQNSKALLSTTISDGMYYECTYNGDKNELYLDAYKKFENKCIKVEE